MKEPAPEIARALHRKRASNPAVLDPAFDVDHLPDAEHCGSKFGDRTSNSLGPVGQK